MVVMKQHFVQTSSVEHFPAHQALHEMLFFVRGEVCRIRLLSFARETSFVFFGKRFADNLSKAGWSWGCVSVVGSYGRTIFVADAHRDENQRFVVRADEKLTAFVELESAIRAVTDYCSRA